MFGLFSKKTHKPTVIQEDKKWIEENILWFIKAFGLEEIKKRPFVLPTKENFPYSNLNDDTQFQKLFEQLCQDFYLEPDQITVHFFDNVGSKQWNTFIPEGKVDEPLGLYNSPNNEKKTVIQLAKSLLNNNPEHLIAVIVHELCHAILLGEKYVNINEPDMEALTDLLAIFSGYGIFFANSCQSFQKESNYWSTNQSGYLPNEIISYANAFMCYITQHQASAVIPYLNSNTKALFKKDVEYLQNTSNTSTIADQVAKQELIYKLNRQIDDEFGENNFDKVLELCLYLLKVDTENKTDVYSCMGYALLQKKEYNEAVEAYTKIIDVDSYLFFPFTMRGYCKLQLGNFEEAFTDLTYAFEMNSNDSVSWRNLGVYYLFTKNYEKALEYFTKAVKLEPYPDLINFYLAQTYKGMGNTEKAAHYFNKSKECNEHNDSTIKHH